MTPADVTGRRPRQTRLPGESIERGTVVLGGVLHDAGRERLEQQHQVVEAFTPEALLAAVAEADALYVRPPGIATAAVLAAAPALRVVATSGAGLDHIDVAAATEAGIGAVHMPGVGAVAVAEHAVALAMALAKSLFWADRATRAGEFGVRALGRPAELAGRTAALIGFGNIGREVGRRLGPGLGMRVLVFDPMAAELPDFAERADTLEEALAAADLVSLHLPMLPDTHHIIGADQLALMKTTAWLVNTSRGALIDEAALVEALRGDVIAGAGIDVFEAEPAAATNPLFALDNVIVSPHLAGLTGETAALLARTTAERICSALAGEIPEGLANGHELGLHPTISNGGPR